MTIASDAVIICHEEGRIVGLPRNCVVAGIEFVGPIVFAGVEVEEFCDFPLAFDQFKRMFKNLWED